MNEYKVYLHPRAAATHSESDTRHGPSVHAPLPPMPSRLACSTTVDASTVKLHWIHLLSSERRCFHLTFWVCWGKHVVIFP